MPQVELIDQAAKEYGGRRLAKELHFKAGAEWALEHPELMREEILEFVSWRDSKKTRLEYKHGRTLSDDELFTLYLEHLNQKK
jgi:hypothetical protein